MYDISLIFPTSPFLINQQVFPPLGILYLSSYLKQFGWKVQCIDMALGHTLDMIESEVVGVSFTTPQRDEAYKIAQHCYNKGIITIAGGPHPTHMPDECLLHDFDIVVRGEGEKALDYVLEALAIGGDVQRIIDNRLDQVEIDEEPFPDRDSIDIHAYDYKIDGRQATTVMTTRGCPFNCSFCARALQGCRMQSAGRTSAEIVKLYEKYGFDAFMVFDGLWIYIQMLCQIHPH
jgi:anaerobic magnesium-protoporphyrin IX monomethyl ester cyclase